MGRFEVLILGCTGGPFESNLSSYALIDVPNKQAILLDAGSPLTGLQRAFEMGHLSDFFPPNASFLPPRYFLQEIIKAILISHVHLDHILGLVMASQIDTPKPLLGMDIMIDYLRDHIFNGKIWPNQGSEGKDALSLYQYMRLSLGQEIAIPNTQMRVEPFLLNHAHTLDSSAFLIACGQEYVLYFGDTSSDSVEREKKNKIIWQKVAPLVAEKKLQGIFLECSYPNRRRNLYGHLNPHLLGEELKHLQKISGTSLAELKVIVTHRKQSTRLDEDAMEVIAKELSEGNTLGIEYIFPKQGERVAL